MSERKDRIRKAAFAKQQAENLLHEVHAAGATDARLSDYLGRRWVEAGCTITAWSTAENGFEVVYVPHWSGAYLPSDAETRSVAEIAVALGRDDALSPAGVAEFYALCVATGLLPPIEA